MLEADLEKCKQDRKEYDRRPGSEIYSDFMIQCLGKASVFKWRFVSDDDLW